jgi:signal transduction histidine kinase
MVLRPLHRWWNLAVVPLGIAMVSALGAAGINIPNQPGVLLLVVAYCAYRGAVVIGLLGAAMHMLYSAVFFSDAQHLFVYSGDNLARMLVIVLVAPAMGLMVGLLRREADRIVSSQKTTETALTKLNAELEQRVQARTAELVYMRNAAEEAQEQTRISEERFRDFARTASDWLWEQDENLRFCYFSPEAFNGSREAAESYLGKTRREVGTAILTEAEWDAHEADLVARRSFRNMITRRLGSDGTIHYTSTSGQPFFDGDGRFCGYRGTARNVTNEVLDEIDLEHRVAERTAEVRALQQKLVEQERRATLDQLTATVSHELRNPLSAIRNSLYVIAQAARTSNLAIERPLDRINRSIQRCENIISQLVEYSQIRVPQRRSVRLDKWLADLLDEQSLPPGIELIRDLGAPSQSVSCDPDHLRRAMLNLIENAVQAIERARSDGPDSTKRASAATDERTYRISVSSRCDAGRMEIAITDDGPGIAPDVMTHIFEPLFSTKAFGIGLGLPLVKQILDHHGGGVAVTSHAGAGACATLWLPLAEANEIAA